MDTNLDGYITREDLNSFGEKSGGQMVTEYQWKVMCEFNHADSDRGISFEDYQKIHELGGSGEDLDEDEVEPDQSGFATFMEFNRARKKLGAPTLSASEWRIMCDYMK